MNSAPPHPSSGDERELRLTALLLGELSEADAAVLRLEIAANAELRKLHDELARTIGLVREARGASHEKTGPAVEPLTLSSDKRNRLLAAFKTVDRPQAQSTVVDKGTANLTATPAQVEKPLPAN